MSVPADERFSKTRPFSVADEGRKRPAAVGEESSVLSRQFSVLEKSGTEMAASGEESAVGGSSFAVDRLEFRSGRKRTGPARADEMAAEKGSDSAGRRK